MGRMADLPPSAPASFAQSPPRSTVATAVLLGAIFLLGTVFFPLWKPLVFAAIVAAALARWQGALAERLWHRRYLAAGIMTLGVLILIVTPLAVMGVMAVRQALEVAATVRQALRTGGLEQMLRPLPDALERLVRPLLQALPEEIGHFPSGASAAGRWAALQVQNVVATLSGFAFDLLMMLIALFFLLADGPRLVAWLRRISPLGSARTQELLEEFRLVSRSIIGASFATGLVQATVATIGYMVAQVPQPIFFGLLTLLASFIPSVGTTLVSLPLAAVMALVGRGWAALFLATWAMVVVATVDNVLRPYLIRGGMNVHGALVFFAVIGGIAIFGLAGIVVGPMALTLFVTLMRFHARDTRLARGAVPPQTAPG